MFAILLNLLVLFAASGPQSAGGGGFTEFYNKYLNYPGFEAWKFINLAIFIALLVYLVKKPLSDAFRAKREAIRAELIKAEEDKQAALAQLTAAEARLVSIEAEKNAILKSARKEAEAEKAHILKQTEIEVTKMREQAQSEITRLAQQTQAELRRFSAEESVRLAEEKLRSEINAETDSRLVKASIHDIGGLN